MTGKAKLQRFFLACDFNEKSACVTGVEQNLRLERYRLFLSNIGTTSHPVPRFIEATDNVPVNETV